MPSTSRLVRWSFSFLPLALVFSPLAHAQTVIELTDPSQPANPCIFTTNGNGVTADPATGHLRATGAFGTNCQTAPLPVPSINPGPANWVLPSGWAIGASAQVQWAAANADLCTYDGSSIPAGQSAGWPWPASGVACNSTSSCATPHNLTLTPAVAGNYHFRLNCTYNGNVQTAAVSEISANVTAAPEGCAAPTGWTRVTQGFVRYQSGDGPRLASPTTQWGHVWGQRSSAPGTFNPWPYLGGNMVGVEFGGKQYVALEFTPNRTGSFWLTGSSTAFQHYGGGGNGISASISKRCGDFTSTPGPTSPTPTGCWFNNLGPSGHISYSIVTGNYECKLQLGETYYLNMVYTPLPITSESRSECAAGGCRMQYQNNCPGSVDCGSVSP